MNTKIIVALVIGIAVIGLTGAASAFNFDSFYPSFGSYSTDLSSYSPSFGSYAHTSIDYTSPIESISVDYYGTHTSDFSASGITTQADITLYESPSLFNSYTPSYTPSYTSSPSIFNSYVPIYSFWP